jgi:hypothetical protein
VGARIEARDCVGPTIDSAPERDTSRMLPLTCATSTQLEQTCG